MGERQHSATLRYALAAAVGALAPSAFLLHELNAQIERAAPGECNAFLDAALWPQMKSIHAHLQCVGATGRALHLRMYAFDLALFPLIYCTALFGGMALVWGPGSRLPAAAVVTFAFDVLENASNVLLLRRFPRSSATVETASVVGTRGKWLSLAASLVLVALGVAVRSVRKRSTPAPHKSIKLS
ncbi:hypothetical protein PybrP1_005597 [[Pythium] brassicae (nom. inval.)]|nr:hypothetical protein PybrP1_005597 [[Pythium] brassicae (nom. inval.)]